jgi:hypothetical protein
MCDSFFGFLQGTQKQEVKNKEEHGWQLLGPLILNRSTCAVVNLEL